MSTKWEDLSHNECDRRGNTIEREYWRADFLARPSIMLGIVPKKDGDQWCALYGADLMEGVAGVGETPDQAMAAFDAEWLGRKP